MTAPQQGAVLLLGAGRMGGALLRGWVAAKRFSPIHVVEPAPSDALNRLATDRAITLHSELRGVPVALTAMVIALKPQIMKSEASVWEALGRTQALAVSIAAGISTDFLRGKLGGGARVVRAMPNTPGAIGRGITALYASDGVSAADRGLAEALMAALGETLWVGDEGLMDVVTAVSGSGPAYVFLLAEALAEAGRAEGLDAATADRLARATVMGAGALLGADARGADELRKEVTSPGGTTEAALRVLMGQSGLTELMRRAIEAATRRGRELGKV